MVESDGNKARAIAGIEGSNAIGPLVASPLPAQLTCFRPASQEEAKNNPITKVWNRVLLIEVPAAWCRYTRNYG
jgi:hypothetical protein